MNANKVKSLYDDVLNANSGVRKRKIDLHVHTPASKDFSKGSLSKDDAYWAILDKAIEENIEVIAITDHNTFEGYNYIKGKLDNDQSLREKYKKILILCGIEITCYSKHLLAIFPDGFAQGKQSKFLEIIGIDESSAGTEDALADNLGPSVLIDTIGKYGGFAILAHADANKGFLKEMCKNGKTEGEISFGGKSLAKVLGNKNLLAFQCKSEQNEKIIREKLNNADYNEAGNRLACIKCSDNHGVVIDGNYTGKSGQSIGSIVTEIKLSEVSFSALVLALLECETRMCVPLQTEQRPYIIGMAVKSSIIKQDKKEYAVFHFNSEMNCIIGSRGTGKTTMLEIIQSVLMPENIPQEVLNKMPAKYESAIVFLQGINGVFAIASEPKAEEDKYVEEWAYRPNVKVYRQEGTRFINCKSRESKKDIGDFLAAGYKQRELYDYSRNPDKIMEIVDGFLRWKKKEDYQKCIKQVVYHKNALNEVFEKIEHERQPGEEFKDYLNKDEIAQKIIHHINIANSRLEDLKKMREGMVNELNHVLHGLVQISLTRKLSNPKWKDDVEHLAQKVRNAKRESYEYFCRLKRELENIYWCCMKILPDFNFYTLLIKSEFKVIIDEFHVDLTTEDLESIRECLEGRHLDVFNEDGVRLKYNINAGTKYEDAFKDNSEISIGQNAVALLLIILNAAYAMQDNRPLLMDQPEDDLDNSYIYTTLIGEFQKSKSKRQVIISTHNPNIPVAGDAENISILRFDGNNGYLSRVGSIDSKGIAQDIIEIMEGGRSAIETRMNKYKVHSILKDE